MSWTTIPSRYRVAAPIWTPKRPGTLSRQWRRKAAENPRLLIIVLCFALRFITGALLITGLLITGLLITGLGIAFIARIVALLLGHRLHDVLIHLGALLDRRIKRDIGRVAE